MDTRLARLGRQHAENPSDIATHAELVRCAHRINFIQSANIGMGALVGLPVIKVAFPEIVRSTHIIWADQKLDNYEIGQCLLVLRKTIFPQQLRRAVINKLQKCLSDTLDSEDKTRMAIYSNPQDGLERLFPGMVACDPIVVSRTVSVPHLPLRALIRNTRSMYNWSKQSEGELRAKWIAECAPMLLGAFV